MKSPSGFLWKNPWKKETLLTYYYSAIFRMQLLLLPPGKLRKGWGRENEESAGTASREGYRQAARIAQIVLCRRGLSSTLYLGCGMEEGKMVAHAWLRFGEMYVTGGDGGGYTTVARFCKEASGKRG